MKVFGFAGYSGSGKTTVIEQLIPRLVLEGLRVSVIKHAHHDFDIDRPGKDSYRHREAGATEVMLTAGNRWVLMHELRGGYRVYVDSLMDPPLLDAEVKKIIETNFSRGQNETEELLKITSNILSELTNQLALVTYPKFEMAVLEKIQIVQLSSKRIL